MVSNSFRVISLWSTKVSNLEQSIHSNIWGLGDLIRGTFQLYQICRKHNFSFELLILTANFARLRPFSIWPKYKS